MYYTNTPSLPSAPPFPSQSFTTTNPSIYQGQYYIPLCIPPYLANFYMKMNACQNTNLATSVGGNSFNFDIYYPPYIPCL